MKRVLGFIAALGIASLGSPATESAFSSVALAASSPEVSAAAGRLALLTFEPEECKECTFEPFFPGSNEYIWDCEYQGISSG